MEATNTNLTNKVAEAARDFIWEPENWEAYQDSKESNSAAWMKDCPNGCWQDKQEPDDDFCANCGETLETHS